VSSSNAGPTGLAGLPKLPLPAGLPLTAPLKDVTNPPQEEPMLKNILKKNLAQRNPGNQ